MKTQKITIKTWKEYLEFNGSPAKKFDISQPKVEACLTKHRILSIINKIYDPLGLLTPFTVKLKVLMRRI